jgi:hypothetical protein
MVNGAQAVVAYVLDARLTERDNEPVRRFDADLGVGFSIY